MKHLLFVVGYELFINKNYMQYLYRIYEKKFQELSEIKFLNKNDKNLPFLLEKFSKEYNYITIFSEAQYYSICAKIIATLNDDSLVFKDEILAPTNSISVSGSFLTKINHCQINLLKIKTNEKPPELLGEFECDFKFFCLNDTDEDSAKLLLQTFTKTYDIIIQTSAILDNLILIKAISKNYGHFEAFFNSVRQLFKNKFIPYKNPIEFIVAKLLEKKLKISFAESCTAGLCSATLAGINGISEIFEGSLVVYSNRLKEKWLGVDSEILKDGGEYSKACVFFMLKGALKTTQADFVLAISGVAGEQDDKGIKAGKIFIGAMDKEGKFIEEEILLQGDRNFVRDQAVLKAFIMLLKLRPDVFAI
ncbi:CinA family protein [Campylobacter sp. US33a]|uniref:CinA family protein n=1 Tax=Campylobacter sp. US33a TaxID=2498120 RepID=UPI0010679D2D|nr:CinA family protein [Campylobacter sp. US33a]TEY02386.1 CinA family protein [Campylobacter sp. US33a]